MGSIYLWWVPVMRFVSFLSPSRNTNSLWLSRYFLHVSDPSQFCGQLHREVRGRQLATLNTERLILTASWFLPWIQQLFRSASHLCIFFNIFWQKYSDKDRQEKVWSPWITLILDKKENILHISKSKTQNLFSKCMGICKDTSQND